MQQVVEKVDGGGGAREGCEGGPGDMDATSKARWPNVANNQVALKTRLVLSRRRFPPAQSVGNVEQNMGPTSRGCWALKVV